MIERELQLKSDRLPFDNETKRHFFGISGSSERTRLVTQKHAGAAGQKDTAPMVQELQKMIRDPAVRDRNISEQVLANAAQFGGGRYAQRLPGQKITHAGTIAALAPLIFEHRRQQEEQRIKEKGINVQSLSDLIGLSMEQIVAGQEGTRKSYGFNIGSSG